MVSKASNDYISHRAWLGSVLSGEDVVLRRVSALEYLQLFVGYAREENIDVYAKMKGVYDNINYYVVDSFDGIDYIRHGNVLCSSVNQAINDIFDDFGNADEQALAEALSRYYYKNSESFKGLYIKPKNIERFESVKKWAIEYYNEV
jgi:hypothetical protein